MWLLCHDEPDVLWVLGRVENARPHLLRHFADPLGKQNENTDDTSGAVRPEEELAISPSPAFDESRREFCPTCNANLLVPPMWEEPPVMTEQRSQGHNCVSRLTFTGEEVIIPVDPLSPKSDDQPKKPAGGQSAKRIAAHAQHLRELDAEIARISDHAGLDAMHGDPIVQLSSFMYIVAEVQECLVVEVVRIGNLEKPSQVKWCTVAGSAKEGEQFIAGRGTITFDPGEATKELKVQLVQNDAWNTTTEFGLELLPEGLTGAVLGAYLYHARVKVCDDDAFPTNKYKKQILQRTSEDVPGFYLLVEYFKMNLLDPVVRRGTFKMFLVGALHNFRFLIMLYIRVYLVDSVLNPKKDDSELWPFLGPKSKEAQYTIIPLIQFLPLILFHYLDIKALGWKVGGKSRSILQKALLRKFLNYDEVSRAALESSDVVMAMTRDAPAVVQDGYMGILSLTGSLGKLICVLIYNFTAFIVFDRPFGYLSVIPIAAFPPLMLIFFMKREKITSAKLTERTHHQNGLVSRVNRAIGNYRLIADYNKRSFFVGRFEQNINQFNKATASLGQVVKSNNYFPMYLSEIMVGLVIFLNGDSVIAGDMSLGIFLAEIAICEHIGNACKEIYNSLLDMQAIFPALHLLIAKLNLPTDLGERMALSAASERAVVKRRSISVGTMQIDSLPIHLQNLTYSYNDSSKTPHKHASALNMGGELLVTQGNLIALVGPKGMGKSTLLKILGGVILPHMTDDCIFAIPPHLRVLHISTEVLFYRASLLDNLRFGTVEGSSDADKDRVIKICRMLKVSEEVMDYLETDDVLPWGEVLSLSQRHQLTIARALVGNPEVLCMHKPTQAFDEDTSTVVLKVLQMYVRGKGVFCDTQSWHKRRPRTCIFTCSQMMGVEMADQVFAVTENRGIFEISKAIASDGMVG